MRKTIEAFEILRSRAAALYPQLATIELLLDPELHDAPRHFAHTMTSPLVEIHVAPEIEQLSQSKIRGILMHEFGHATVALGYEPQARGGYEAVERQADAIAESIFAVKIYYDEIGIETLRKCKGCRRPRPKGLR